MLERPKTKFCFTAAYFILSLVCCLKVKRFVDATAESPKTLSGSEKNKQPSESKVNSKEVNDSSFDINKKNEATSDNSQQNYEKHSDCLTGKFVSIYKSIFTSQCFIFFK